jgi:protein-S-isoprenylcysteine O-methyltransferase Ste14
VLGLPIVQLLAALSLAAVVGGFLLGHGLRPQSSRAVKVVAKREPARWTEVVWIGGALLVAVFWSMGVLLVPKYAYDWPASPDFAGSGLIQLLGFLVAIAGGLLFFAAVRALGRHMTARIQVQEGHELVQVGPYRYIRHPAYTAIITSGVGYAVLYLSPLLAVITLVLTGIAVYRARLEEGLLSSPAAFGETYTAYMARTGRFLPRIHSKP